MGYDTALTKAWDELLKLDLPHMITVRFLGDEYAIDTTARKILSLACNVPAKDFYSILLLHYLAARFNGLSALAGEWVDFKELSRVEGYGEAFRARCIEPVIRKYGTNASHLLSVVEKLPATVDQRADAAVVIQAFEGVPVLVTLWGADDEFGPDANMLFDRSITDIFCVEDVVVLGQIVAHHL